MTSRWTCSELVYLQVFVDCFSLFESNNHHPRQQTGVKQLATRPVPPPNERKPEVPPTTDEIKRAALMKLDETLKSFNLSMADQYYINHYNNNDDEGKIREYLLKSKEKDLKVEDEMEMPEFYLRPPPESYADKVVVDEAKPKVVRPVDDGDDGELHEVNITVPLILTHPAVAVKPALTKTKTNYDFIELVDSQTNKYKFNPKSVSADNHQKQEKVKKSSKNDEVSHLNLVSKTSKSKIDIIKKQEIESVCKSGTIGHEDEEEEEDSTHVILRNNKNDDSNFILKPKMFEKLADFPPKNELKLRNTPNELYNGLRPTGHLETDQALMTTIIHTDGQDRHFGKNNSNSSDPDNTKNNNNNQATRSLSKSRRRGLEEIFPGIKVSRAASFMTDDDQDDYKCGDVNMSFAKSDISFNKNSTMIINDLNDNSDGHVQLMHKYKFDPEWCPASDLADFEADEVEASFKKPVTKVKTSDGSFEVNKSFIDIKSHHKTKLLTSAESSGEAGYNRVKVCVTPSKASCHRSSSTAKKSTDGNNCVNILYY